ncbi:MAG TPA: hypothetical protein VFK05_38495 [Polyangiaceae bacterium]|nr:hypothetical protein [Polyangiaceae bacterium]
MNRLPGRALGQPAGMFHALCVQTSALLGFRAQASGERRPLKIAFLTLA